MTREKQIEILMEDRATRSEAEKLLKNGTIIFEDFEENFDKYMEDWKSGYAEGSEDYAEMVENYRKMIETGIPATDWGIVKKNGKTYYIQYVL